MDIDWHVNKPTRSAYLFFFGVVLLAVVFLTPNAESDHGMSFVHLAMKSPWSHPLDWVAAWCSLKIILLNLGLILILLAASLLSEWKQRMELSKRLLLAVAVPALGIWWGGYELAKALF